MSSTAERPRDSRLHRRLWRWHFYAGLFVIPFVIVLALSGTVFLFKPQLERWEERAFLQGPTAAQRVAPSAQVRAALDATPAASFHSYRLPADPRDAAMVHLALGDGGMRDVFVASDGAVVGSLDASTRITEIARRLHSQLLMGARASWVVELAACWAIVMVLTGLFLWWPRSRGVAGVLWPRRARLLRDLHAVTGFWVAAFALVLLLTGLPWTDVWGNAFREVRAQMGWVKGAPQWSTETPAAEAHSAHHHGAMHTHDAPGFDDDVFDRVVAQSLADRMAYPTIVLAPGVALFGPPSTQWTAMSLVQNRPLGATLTFDTQSGDLLTRERFADQHPIDRVVGYGLAWHEGALFGPLNQVIGVFTALALVTMSVTGFLMWRRRRPTGELGAPPLPAAGGKLVGVTALVLVLAALLPLLAASLVVLLVVDLLLPRVSPAAARWMGITRRSA